MSKFERSFHQRDWQKFPVVMELLRQWTLPGEDAKESGVRLAVRRHYCNFYRKGQSVAKLHSTEGSLKLEVHREYVRGSVKSDRTKALTGYESFPETWLAETANVSAVKGWIVRAESYAGAEKAFVDDIVARNPGTIDLEMGLPAYEGEKSAPRMDLVVIEETSRGPALAFWEAKCADNKEARARGEPHVVRQVETYEKWMAKVGREDDVITAYREAADVMLQLAVAAGKPRSAAWRFWESFRFSEISRAIHRPGVIIGGYCPISFTEKKLGSIAAQWASFNANGHLARLTEEFAIAVEFYETKEEITAPLKSLAEGAS